MDPSGPKSGAHTQQTGASVSCRPSSGPQQSFPISDNSKERQLVLVLASYHCFQCLCVGKPECDIISQLLLVVKSRGDITLHQVELNSFRIQDGFLMSTSWWISGVKLSVNEMWHRKRNFKQVVLNCQDAHLLLLLLPQGDQTVFCFSFAHLPWLACRHLSLLSTSLSSSLASLSQVSCNYHYLQWFNCITRRIEIKTCL